MNKAVRFSVTLLMCLLSGMKYSTIDEGDVYVSGGSNISALVMQAVSAILIVIFCLVYRREIVRHLRFAVLPLSLAVLAMVSTLWSIDPGFTFRRSVPLIMATFGAYCVGVEFDPSSLARLYRRMMLWMVYVSVLVVGLLPASGISHGVHSGDWKGAFYHKNKLGMMMALTIITLVVAPPAKLEGFKKKFVVSVAVLFALILLYKAHASSAIVSIAVALAAQSIWYLFQLRRKVLSTVLLLGYPLAAVAVAVILSYSTEFFALLGKDSTLSGRNTLWAGVLEAIKLRPILGYGYGAFWNQVGGTMVLIQERTAFVTVHSHNGFLNLMLHVGILGLAIFLIFLAGCVVLSIQEGRRTKNMAARWFFSFMVYMVVTNLTESQLLEQWYFLWLTLVAFYVTFSIERSRRFQVASVPEAAHEHALQLVAS